MYEEIKQKFIDLENKLIAPELLQDSKAMIKVSQEHASLKKVMALVLELEKIEDNKIYIGGRVKEISYVVFGERKDIDKITVEY